MGVAIGDEAVEQSRVAGRLECRNHWPSIQRGDQAATQCIAQGCTSIGPGYSVVMLYGDVGLADDLV